MQQISPHIIQSLLLGAAPERCEDLRALWAQHTPVFFITEDNAGITYGAQGNRIRFDHKSVAHDWILGFAGWKAFRAYSPAIISARGFGISFGPELLAQDAGLKSEESDLDNLAYAAYSVRIANSLEMVEWPPTVPQPAASSTGFPIEDRAAFDLLAIAVATVFLHEMHHVKVYGEQTKMLRIEEERACDAFALDFLTQEIGEYAAANGHPESKVRMKRSMGLALAGYIIHEATPYSGKLGSEDYPPTLDRFEAFVVGSSASVDSEFWIFSTSLLLAIMRSYGGLKITIPFASYKELCIEVLKHAKALCK